MGLIYTLLYRLRITPWEQAAKDQQHAIERLLEREADERGKPGRALDLGCGSGRYSVMLAERGWEVTGIDQVGLAIKRAEKHASEHHVHVRFLVGDVTALDPNVVGGPYDLILDVGCFHGLKNDERAAMGRGASRVASPNASLLMMAFKPGSPKPLPHGADEKDIARAFPGWEFITSESASADNLPGRLKKAAPTWYRFRRSAS
ncbi:class I SAM-dependent methyltransferase [Hoyosella altamirensis]|uniref:SAM-dependent methyltransferase n=1 Tax=Hoyosella altamirensis TaxID=616997 RepID=A0A839RRU5_9ACTN|nr:class I SAM-dependent methyltransferase [Hoyosella altamirensis]MBB3038938.1 SAM-dependent methyltransferase [Hoyosella altamirensis]